METKIYSVTLTVTIEARDENHAWQRFMAGLEDPDFTSDNATIEEVQQLKK